MPAEHNGDSTSQLHADILGAQAAVVEMETSFEEHNRAAEGMQAELEAQIQAALSAKADQDAEVAKLQQDKADQALQLDQVPHLCMI